MLKAQIHLLIVLCAMLVAVQSASAQCGAGGRYLDTIFSSYTVSTVTYSDTFNLPMDIYQPVGDTASRRPLVVLAHGGAFVAGTRTDDSAVVWLCRDLATKGYVTASIEYRLPTNLLAYYNDTVADITEIIQAVGDLKAAVRYFYQDVYTANIYRIDTTRIFEGGNSAGAVMAVFYGYLDTLSKAPPYLQTIIAQNGGLAGNSGNPGYSNTVRGIVNLAGGLNDPSWISPCSLPVVSAQGTEDSTVPYTCGYAEIVSGFYVDLRMCGLGSMQPYITVNTPFWSSLLFPGQGHTPWQNGGPLFVQVDTLVTGFLNRAQCTVTPTGCPTVNGIGFIPSASGDEVRLFPNPASGTVNIRSSGWVEAVVCYDATGRLIARYNGIHSTDYQMNIAGLSPGVYTVKIYNSSDESLPAVYKMAVE